MPKTYNQRQITDLRLEAEHAPPLPEEPDVTPYIRFFPPKEVEAIVKRIERQVGAGKVTHLRPPDGYVLSLK